jgi:DNA-binding helix-hairpin-helix protein with protein kinase domain
VSSLLKSGLRLRTEFSEVPVVVDRLLGGGGQGEVYTADMAGQLVAAKWYKPEVIVADAGLRNRLRRLRDGRRPQSGKFLWPMDLLVSDSIGGFGYVMPYRDKRFSELNDIIFAEGGSPASLRSRVTAGLELAESFAALHGAGCCYHDINFGNVAIDPANGEVRICDTDNVDHNGVPGFVLGTPGFMAPELVQRQAFPTRSTDLWSLAVLLFWMFIEQHPLLGRREYELEFITSADQDALFGSQARFIFDPLDTSNAPVPGYHDRALQFWSVYPNRLRELFLQAFTDGIRSPSRRVYQSDWQRAMAALRDAILPCPHCGAECFYQPGTELHCWSCQRAVPPPRCIVLPGYAVVATDGAELFSYHLDPTRQPSSGGPLASVVRHPEHPDVIGLENLSQAPWRVTFKDGNEDRVEPNQRVRLREGVRIAFGKVEGVIR